MSRWLRAFVYVSTISIASSAFAVDGVIEINQTSAIAGDITPGDAPGLPVNLTLTASYRLTSNLTLADENESGIVVDADNVTIDLNGFGIIGVSRCSMVDDELSCAPRGVGTGIRASIGATGTTVRNGFVNGNGSYGIIVNAESYVDSVLVTDNGSGAVALGDDSLLTRSRIVRNGGVGVGGLATRIAIVNNVITQSGTQSIVSASVKPLGGNLCDDRPCSATPLRLYYLTKTEFAANFALTACEEGFHMASLFEIIDVSNLRYDTVRGDVEYDSGEGPPGSNTLRGWLRTGTLFTGSGLGEDSCDAWSTTDPDKDGRSGFLQKTSTDASFPWKYMTFPCDFMLEVWCIED